MKKWLHLDYIHQHGSSAESNDLLRRLQEGQLPVHAALIDFWVEKLPALAQQVDPVNYPGISLFVFEESLIPYEIIETILAGLSRNGRKCCDACSTTHRAIVLGTDQHPETITTWIAIYVEKSVKGFKPAAA